MRNYTEDMHQPCTYWAPGENDGFGGTTAADPETFNVRWQDHAELARDSDGNEFTTSAIVYVPKPLQNGGWLALGEHDGSYQVAGARQIRNTQASPDLDADEMLNKVLL